MLQLVAEGSAVGQSSEEERRETIGTGAWEDARGGEDTRGSGCSHQ